MWTTTQAVDYQATLPITLSEEHDDGIPKNFRHTDVQRDKYKYRLMDSAYLVGPDEVAET
jgi:hypothetical protein